MPRLLLVSIMATTLLMGCASTSRLARLERDVRSQGVLLNVCADAVLDLQEERRAGMGRLVVVR